MRTVAEDMYDAVPRGDFRILESYVRALSSARTLIYIENQFLWAPEIVEILADKLRDPPSPEFRLVIVLPAKANNGADDTRGQLGVLSDADHGNRRMLAADDPIAVGRAATIRSTSTPRWRSSMTDG